MNYKLIISIFTILLFTANNSFPASNQLPDLSNSSEFLIDQKEVDEYLSKVIHMFSQSGKLITDPLVNEYVNNLGYSLVAHSDNPNINFNFYTINDRVVNAFATLGGFIAIHAGLILAAENESELAGVIGHEIAHVTQGHILRSVESAQKAALPIALATLAALLATGGEQVAPILMTGSAALQQMQINFTRSNEYEADRIGIQTLYNAGYDPNGMAVFFEKMATIERSFYSAIPVPEQLRTHPVSVTRIAEAKNRAAEMGLPKTTEQMEFLLIQNRLKIFTSQSIRQTLKKLQYDLQYESNVQKRYALSYGIALAHMENNDANDAITILAKLIAKDEARRPYQLALAEAYVIADKMEMANQQFEKLISIYPNNKAVNISYAKNLIAQREDMHAYQLLHGLSWDHPNDINLLKLKAKAANNSGNKLANMETMAQVYVLEGKTHEAMQQLKRILKSPNLDYYMKSRVTAKLEEIKRNDPKLAKAAAKEKRKKSKQEKTS